MNFDFKLNLKVLSFCLEKQKSFIPKKIFLSRTAKLGPKDGVSSPNFQWRFWLELQFFLQMEVATECQFGQWILYRIRLPIEFQGDLSNVFWMLRIQRTLQQYKHKYLWNLELCLTDCRTFPKALNMVAILLLLSHEWPLNGLIIIITKYILPT